MQTETEQINLTSLIVLDLHAHTVESAQPFSAINATLFLLLVFSFFFLLLLPFLVVVAVVVGWL